MMSKETEKKREQVHIMSMDEMVPQDHLLRNVEKAIDFSFIYDLVKEKYSEDKGRPSLDPVMLIKIVIIQYLYGIKSMRQTIKEIEVNVAYRWFLGLTMYDAVPHFSTFGKNYTRRFKGTDLFEQIFTKILEECFRCNFVDPSIAYIDGTHIKAHANKKKSIQAKVKKEALFYEKELRKEIDKDREEHGKKPLKDKDDDDNDETGEQIEIKESTTDSESGLFHKGEHKEVFAYVAQSACDKHGWIMGYTVNRGNEHDSRNFLGIYKKVTALGANTIVADAAYKTPAIARLIIEDNKTPVFPYKRPYTKKGFFRKHEYVYDEYYDCYICPNNQILFYSTTNREGYKEYKSKGYICEGCPNLNKCTNSKEHIKVVTRHIWEEYIEICENIRHTTGMKEIYDLRKETIERIFGDAKENHGMRYTHYNGKHLMEMKVGLTFACLNLKKLVKMKKKYGLLEPILSPFFAIFDCLMFSLNNNKKRHLEFVF